jgi:hypothetical protein
MRLSRAPSRSSAHFPSGGVPSGGTGDKVQLLHQPERLARTDRQHPHQWRGGADIDARLSPDGRYLLVDGSGMHFVSVFAVNGGNLTELPSPPTPLPAGVTSSAGIVNI